MKHNTEPVRKVKIQKIRMMIQITVLAVVVVAALNHYLISIDRGIPWISESFFHYICPTCGVVGVYHFFAASTLWAIKIKSILGISIGLVVMMTIVFGPILCGFICPFGTIQDGISKIGKKIWKGKYNTFVPAPLDSKLKYLRYLVLVGILILTASSGVLFIEKSNPYHAFLGIFNRTMSSTALVMLSIIIFLSLFIHRPWCKYLCPYGALLGIFNQFKVFRILRNKNTCIGCSRCNHACPMNINLVEKEEVRDVRCIVCLECVADKVCPKEKTLLYTSKDEIESEEKEDEKH